MKDKILEVLKLTRNNALNMEEIYNKIYHSEIEMDKFNSLKEELNKLQEEHLVYCVNSKKGLYTLNPFREGILHIRRNKDVIVTCDLGDIKIEKAKTYGALEGDKVLIRITDFNYSLGSIKEIIERKGLIGEVKTIKGKRFVMANNNLYMIDLPNSIVDGLLVGIKVDKKKIGRYYKATLDRVICHKNAPRVDEFKILYDHGFNNNYEEEIKEELKSIPSEVRKIDFINRKDLTDKTIFTIDGDDTKDIDDAISIEKKGNNYILGVHIADVSYYVKENSYIDKSAREKATSVYMPGVVFPMYPVFLSNGICSLNPDVDRCSISCVMEIDKNGKLIDFDIFNKGEDLIFKNCSSEELKSCLKEYVLKYKDMDINNFQVLAPLYKGDNGIDDLNYYIQELINKRSVTKTEITYNGVLFRQNDKVLQLVNNIEENIFNGDIGKVLRIENKKSKAMTIDFDSNIVRITASNFSDLKLGYCISIHKAQGSEFDVVIIPILNKYSIMLYKKLIYTATTRAKKKLILIGELSALEKAILNDKENIRKTSLKDFIISCIK